MRTIKEWLSEIDKADREHSPTRRASLADALVDELREIFGTDDRFEEICNAERDGRCVVLPCKIGDTVYCTNTGKVKEDTITSFGYGGNLWFMLENTGDIHWTVARFGKTVFPTKEAAEQALKGGAE